MLKPGLSLVAISWKPMTCSHHCALRSPSVTVRSMCPKPLTGREVHGDMLTRVNSPPCLTADAPTRSARSSSV